MRKPKRTARIHKKPLASEERAFFEKGRKLVLESQREITALEAHIAEIEQTPPGRLESLSASADRHEAKEKLLKGMRKALEQKREGLEALRQQIGLFAKKC